MTLAEPRALPQPSMTKAPAREMGHGRTSYPFPKTTMGNLKGAKLKAHATIKENIIVPFDVRKFAAQHHTTMSGLMRTALMPANNLNNWLVNIPGFVPFAVAKALMISLDREGISLWENEIQGKLKWKKPALRVTDECKKLADKYDAARVGTKLKMSDGSVLTIASAAADAQKLREQREAGERTAREASEAAERAKLASEAMAAQLKEERIEAERRSTLTQEFTVMTPSGPVEVRMPAQIPPGEREIYMGLLIRLNYRNSQLEREASAKDMLVQGLEGQIANLKDALRRLSAERGEERKILELVDTKNAGTIAALSTPRQATGDDYGAAKTALRAVPELVSLVQSLEQTSKSFRKGAAPVS